MKFLDGKDVRLTARYELEPPIQIRWDTASRRLLLRKVDVSCQAEIRDISLLGALVVIDGPVDAEVGAVVQIRRGDQTGLVKVRRVDTDLCGATFVGVQFVTVGDVLPDLHEIVRELRSGDDTLERVWELAQ